MKAAVFHSPSAPLAIEEVPDLTTAPGELTLRVKHCGICGTDLHYTEEGTPVVPGSVIGHEFCGEIVAVGEGVQGWKEGQRVVSLPFAGCGKCRICLSGNPVWCRSMRDHASGRMSGGFAEYTNVAASGTVLLPEGTGWEEAALVEPLAVGLHGYRRARLEPGANVLVVGAGPVGLAVVAWARALGARRIVVTARSTRGAEMALAMGATEFLTSDRDVRREFRKLAGGDPDAIFECVGSPGILEQCVNWAPIHGKVIVLGGCMKPDLFTPALAMNKEIEVIFSLAYDLQDFKVSVDLVGRGRLDPTPMVTDRVGFDAFPAAFEALRHRTNQCKVLLTPN